MSTDISLLIQLIVDVKKCVRHFFVHTYPLYMRPQIFRSSQISLNKLEPEGGYPTSQVDYLFVVPFKSQDLKGLQFKKRNKNK